MKERLPFSERQYLSNLKGDELRARACVLHDAGWSLASIAEAFDPPRQRSTVRAWVLSRTPPSHTQPPIPSLTSFSPSSSAYSTIGTAESWSSSSPAPLRTRARRRIYDPENPKVPAGQRNKISQLAPLARRYRSRTSPNGTYARANQELTMICVSLYRSGASIRELSLAAGVTYRAMARRIGRYNK
jgi:hypothetical protein